MTTATVPAVDWSALTVETVPTLKAPKTQDDVPQGVRNLVEKSLNEQAILRVDLPSAEAVKEIRKLLALYSTVRAAGIITVRCTVQPNGTTIHLKASPRLVAANGQTASTGGVDQELASKKRR